MAKKPKEEWQTEVRKKLDIMGIGYKELAERIGLKEGSVRQAMCKNNCPGIKKKICDYFKIKTDKEAV